MSVLRKALALAGTSAAAAALITLPVSPASATTADDTWAVTVSGSYWVVDDDSTVFSNSYSYASSKFTKTYYVGKSSGSAYEDVWSACAGGEVNGTSGTSVMRGDNGVYVDFALRLHEGDSCYSSDVDGRTQPPAYFLSDGQTQTRRIQVGNTSEGGKDAVTLDVTISARRL
ncbi:hypothetical protein [Streptomyces sp. NPDC057909]|uniref:hypothetical protein n=1 Tax=Streptomyces sp. NPDC057909 TaxID=3346277 RepID=UPI0036F0B079